MKLYCPECFKKLGITLTLANTLQKVGIAIKKPLYCPVCNKSYTYDEAKKTKGA